MYCPPGYEPLNYPGTALPLVCGPSSRGTCPYGYQCLRSFSGGPYACCRLQTIPVGSQCPAGFQLYISPNGASVSCIVGNPASCPLPSVCAASSNPYQNFCCVKSTVPQQLQCPNGYALPVDGSAVPCQLEIGTTVSRCPFGSGCKPSLSGQSGVCCRSLARCPTGYQETINTATQEIVECTGSTLAPQTCPSGSTCLLSSTTVSSLCCTSAGTTTVSPNRCPVGYQDVTPTGSTCLVDTQCPSGARCMQPVCCMPSVRPQCPNGLSPALDSSNWPITCSEMARWCPQAQSTCTQSVTTVGFICCNPSQVCPSTNLEFIL